MNHREIAEQDMDAARKALRFPRPCHCFLPDTIDRLPACRDGLCADAVRSIAQALTEAHTAGRNEGLEEAAKPLPSSDFPDDMDPECRTLCETVNECDGTRTFESCCGHGHKPFCVWFVARTMQALSPIAQACLPTFSGTYGWDVVALYSNSNAGPIVFMLQGPIGDYTGADRIAAAIRALKEGQHDAG